jgi:hypothetical protein
MSVVNMDKWLSGEVETFFAPNEVPPPPVIPDSSHNEEISSAQSKPRADQPPVTMDDRGYNPTMVVGAAIASIGSIAAAALVCLVIWTRPTAPPAPDPSPAAVAKPAAPVQSPTVKPIPDRLPSDPGLDRIRRDMSFRLDHTTRITLAPDRQPPSPRWAPRRHHWPSTRAGADHGEAARLMRAELREMGITPARRHR